MNASALAKYDDLLEGYPGTLSSETRRYIRDGVPLKASAAKASLPFPLAFYVICNEVVSV